MLSYSEMTNAVKKIVSYFNWEVFGFFLYNFADAGKGHSECSLVLSPFNRQFNNGTSFHETFENGTHKLLKEKLKRLKEKSRSKSFEAKKIKLLLVSRIFLSYWKWKIMEKTNCLSLKSLKRKFGGKSSAREIFRSENLISVNLKTHPQLLSCVPIQKAYEK